MMKKLHHFDTHTHTCLVICRMTIPFVAQGVSVLLKGFHWASFVLVGMKASYLCQEPRLAISLKSVKGLGACLALRGSKVPRIPQGCKVPGRVCWYRCLKKHLLGEPLPCKPAAKTALQSPRFGTRKARLPSFLLLRRGVFFTDTGTYFGRSARIGGPSLIRTPADGPCPGPECTPRVCRTWILRGFCESFAEMAETSIFPSNTANEYRRRFADTTKTLRGEARHTREANRD